MASIKDYWIEKLQSIKEFDVIAATEDDEILDLRKEINTLIDDQFIQTAQERGIVRREKMLKITPFGDDTLDDRRFRVLSRWNDKVPYTYRVLLGRLNQLCGENGYTVELNNELYTLKIRIELTQKRMFDEVKLMGRRICSANLVLDIDLRYNQYKDIKDTTHGNLKLYTHYGLRNEVIQ